MSNASSWSQTPFGADPSLVLVAINDFSPGVYQYGFGTMPTTYSVQYPLGSASSAFRCINEPGVGLVPFPQYTIPHDQIPWQPLQENAGFSTVGLITTLGSQDADALYIAASNDVFTATGVWWTPATPPATLVTTDQTGTVSFTKQRSTYTAGIQSSPNAPQVWFTSPNTNFLYASPDWNNERYTLRVSTPATFSYAIISQTSRILALSSDIYEFDSDLNFPLFVESNEDIYFTDPPQAISFNVAPNIFATENYSGYGAWGSFSTGELLLIKCGGGGVVVSGDAGFPSSAAFLPGIKGTGAVLQRATPCQQGLVYTTETDGVYAWNGGNTSTKISTQIPNNATIREDLTGFLAPSLTSGPSTFHDNLGNWVFFPNNWVFDSINNSWWQSEDPDTINFGCFAHSTFNSDRYMWAVPAVVSPSAPAMEPFVLPYRFDTSVTSSSYSWTSNPIPAQGAGNLAELAYCEIVCSNPTSYLAQIVVTPTCPPSQTPFPQQNPAQPMTFLVPPTTAGYRAAQRCGYVDYNIEINVTAQNLGAQPAPVIHEINLGFLIPETSDTGGAQPITGYWILDDPVYGILDVTTVLV